MSEETCGDCRYWKRRDETDDELSLGFCRRYPPTLCPEAEERPVQGKNPHGYWPLTFQSDWCGEFQKKPPSGAPGFR